MANCASMTRARKVPIGFRVDAPHNPMKPGPNNGFCGKRDANFFPGWSGNDPIARAVLYEKSAFRPSTESAGSY